jgi:hypothetical protein
MKKVFVLSLMLCFVMVVSAQQQQRRGGMGMMNDETLAELKKELTLTDKQADSIKVIYADYATAMNSQRESIGGDREKMREVMTSLGEKRNQRIKANLSADQFTKFEKWEADRRQRMGGGGRPGGGGGRPN